MTVTDYFLDNKQVDLEKKYVYLYEDIVCIFVRLETKISIVPQLQWNITTLPENYILVNIVIHSSSMYSFLF